MRDGLWNYLHAVLSHGWRLAGGGLFALALAVLIDLSGLSQPLKVAASVGLFTLGLLPASFAAWKAERLRANTADARLAEIFGSSPDPAWRLHGDGRYVHVRVTNRGMRATFRAMVEAREFVRYKHNIWPGYGVWSHQPRVSDECVIEKGVSRDIFLGYVVETHDVSPDPEDTSGDVFETYGWRIPRFDANKWDYWEGDFAPVGDDTRRLGHVIINLVADPPMIDGAARIIVYFNGLTASEPTSVSRVAVRPSKIVRAHLGEEEDLVEG